MRLRAAPIVATLALAACSDPAPKPASAPAPMAAPAMLAGVDLTQPVTALGTEPFWSVDLTATSLVYTSPDTPPVTANHPGPTIQGTTAKYAATADGQPLEVTLIATECSDGMSDRIYPMTAIVKRGGTTLNGCAGPKAAMVAQPPA